VHLKMATDALLYTSENNTHAKKARVLNCKFVMPDHDKDGLIYHGMEVFIYKIVFFSKVFF